MEANPSSVDDAAALVTAFDDAEFAMKLRYNVSSDAESTSFMTLYDKIGSDFAADGGDPTTVGDAYKVVDDYFAKPVDEQGPGNFREVQMVVLVQATFGAALEGKFTAAFNGLDTTDFSAFIVGANDEFDKYLSGSSPHDDNIGGDLKQMILKAYFASDDAVTGDGNLGTLYDDPRTAVESGSGTTSALATYDSLLLAEFEAGAAGAAAASGSLKAVTDNSVFLAGDEYEVIQKYLEIKGDLSTELEALSEKLLDTQDADFYFDGIVILHEIAE